MAIILFALLQSRNEVWKPVAWIYFEIRFALLLSWPILGPKMMTSLNSGGNISIRASVHLCKFVISPQGYQKYSRRFFYIYLKASWKNVITFWAILHRLASISIDIYPLIVPSSHVITFPVLGFYAVFTIFLVVLYLLSWTL